MVHDSFNQRMEKVLQMIYNHNKLLAYDLIVMVNHFEGTNFIIQNGIVYDSFDY